MLTASCVVQHMETLRELKEEVDQQKETDAAGKKAT